MTVDLKIEPAAIETSEVPPDPGSCLIDGEHSLFAWSQPIKRLPIATLNIIFYAN
jgi:hypothetical protein